MGRKRIAVVGLVVAIVVGLVVLLVFQARPDERLLAGYVPEFEKRFGILLSFESVRASLTGVVIENVQVRSAKSGGLLCTAKSIGVGLRIGPLLLGDLQITGVRLSGLEVFMGPDAGGADLEQWRSVAAHFEGREDPSSNHTGGNSKDVEFSLESGSLRFSHEGVQFSVTDIGGRLTRRGVCVLRTGALELSVGQRRLVAAERVEATRSSPGQEVELELGGLRVELPADRKQIKEAAESLDNLRRQGKGEESVEGESVEGENEGNGRLRISLAAGDARFELSRDEDGMSSVVRDIALRVRLYDRGWLLNASGHLESEKDHEVSLDIERNASEPLIVGVEVAQMPLAVWGPLLIDRQEFSWAGARVSAKVSASLFPSRRSVSGQASFSGLELQHEAIAMEPLRDLGFVASFEAHFPEDESLVEFDSLVIERGQARLEVKGHVRTDRLAFDLGLRVPRTSCRHVLSAVPRELRERLEGVVLDGQFEMGLRLAVDRESPRDTVFEPVIDNRCRIVELGELPPPDSFRRPFAYSAVDEKGQSLRLVTGPGTDRWTSLHRISVFVSEALLTTEDGKFFHHRGVTAPEVRRAIELNLEREKLTHGASTITMQLAKNLFLDRGRTVARKLQELFFVWYLESNFTKEELLELYLNIVEFGPSLYGITDASLYYFGREPAELSALEAVFLIKLLPSPVSRHKIYVAGTVNDRTMSMLRKVLRVMRVRRRLSDFELQTALGETLVFHRQGDPLPALSHEYLRGISDIVGSPVIAEEQDDEEQDDQY
jgi:hypothetical protein